MSNAKHTPEPWMNTGTTAIISLGGVVATCPVVLTINRDEGVREAKANAAHIVDCVNNCANINPKSVPKLLEVCKKLARVQNGPGKGDEDRWVLGMLRIADEAEEAIADAEEK